MSKGLPTPPASPIRRRLVLCADGGGSKVCVVIRAEDGHEVRGLAGPCNVQSVGYQLATQSILLATYRALSLLSPLYLPQNFALPDLVYEETISLSSRKTPDLNGAPPSPGSSHSTADSEKELLPFLNTSVFESAWLGLAGINGASDADAFKLVIGPALELEGDRLQVSNDVNLLAAPFSQASNIDHVVAVVAGTGTVGRTLAIGHAEDAPNNGHTRTHSLRKALPLQDVGTARGWGHLLCDEGSAFWLGRLAIRSILLFADKIASTSIYASPPPAYLPLHRDIMSYFGVTDPFAIIALTSLTGPESVGLDPGGANSKRNALVAGLARVVLDHAFPSDDSASCPEAIRLAKQAVIPLIDLTMTLLGDQSAVYPDKSALALGGGLTRSTGYAKLLLDGLRDRDVKFVQTSIVEDAALEGTRALARATFDSTQVEGF